MDGDAEVGELGGGVQVELGKVLCGQGGAVGTFLCGQVLKRWDEARGAPQDAACPRQERGRELGAG
ncbi:hypothetical protein [Streptomyces bullii]|uniref:Uncharacterized protein n=1 Tax=Streptomyces bullii TaxID=349910 RepID=A0ABW0V2E7_9ACTN